ncbi:hypothetical protein [Deinococcus sp. Leaf326]|uniref:hypothetical protein n=1 Tax=Deinococcus sp. Leaf326 TaxID=1736338 RepID=UPI0006FC920F|nr:hypothetical protein [Deinococcus sp. Leaf326]KQR15456.1 hypothetical protein ASF71_20525 [Deinococcus sp. Leaf326]
MGVEETWPPALPEVVQSWPVPRGHKSRPARWIGGDAAQYRAFFQGVLDERGADASAQIWNDAPRSPHAAATRWYYPGVPMYATGRCHQDGARPQHGFLVPAQAALLALDHGHVNCRAHPLEHP